MEKLKLSPPWITYKNELETMFADDADISIRYDEEDKEIKLFVGSVSKAAALERLLRHEVTLGNVTLKITVIPPNEIDILHYFNDAFSGNPQMAYTMPIESPFGMHRFVVFRKEVVQFFNDQLDDPRGLKSTLLQDIAKDIFNDDLQVYYCTDPGNRTPLGAKPLGEWP